MFFRALHISGTKRSLKCVSPEKSTTSKKKLWVSDNQLNKSVSDTFIQLGIEKSCGF